MSEQHAESVEEEFDSAHSRLDSILDQLNALGTTDAPTSTEISEPSHPARTLQSVPDLDFLTPPALPEQVSAPPLVENHELEITPPAVPQPALEDVAPELSVVEPTALVDHEEDPISGGHEELVFMLDGPLETEQAPDATGAEFAEPEFRAPEFPVSQTNEDVDAGWVSHHETERQIQTELSVPTLEDVEDPPAPASRFDTPTWAEEPSDGPVELEAESASAGVFDLFDHDESEVVDGSADVGSDFFQLEGASGLGELEMELRIDDVDDTPAQDEPTLETLSPDVVGTDFTSETVASIEEGDETGYESLFETDEELPLPDFTGVWADEDALGSVWAQDEATQQDNVPDPVEQRENSWGISVGRNELDSLRPAEEEVVAVEPAGVARKLQLVMVVLFGLIALAVIFLDDPAVVDQLREIYDGLLG